MTTETPADAAAMPGLDSLIGARVVEMTGSRVELHLEVTPALHQPFGILHGGVHCSLVESSASMGAMAWYSEKYGNGGTVVGVSNQTDFLRGVRDGRLVAVAEPIHQGRLQQLWQVNITDSEDRLVARGQVRIQNLAPVLV